MKFKKYQIVFLVIFPFFIGFECALTGLGMTWIDRFIIGFAIGFCVDMFFFVILPILNGND